MKKNTLLIILVSLLLVFGQVHAKKGGQGNGGNGGGDKGGFGELGDGCLTFLNYAGAGRIYDDERGSYCNGTAGQISVPVRLRFDTKKFNGDDRVFTIQASCSSATDNVCSLVGTNGKTLQMSNEDFPGSPYSGLDWTLMDAGGITRVEMGIKIDRTHFLYFNEKDVCFDPDNPNDDVHGGPLWVRCDGDANDDTLCDQWTVSTDGSFPTGAGPFAADSAKACLKSGAFGNFLDKDVIADFTWNVCVMGLGIPDCP